MNTTPEVFWSLTSGRPVWREDGTFRTVEGETLVEVGPDPGQDVIPLKPASGATRRPRPVGWPGGDEKYRCAVTDDQGSRCIKGSSMPHWHKYL